MNKQKKKKKTVTSLSLSAPNCCKKINIFNVACSGESGGEEK
jgi:hypothetical protein